MPRRIPVGPFPHYYAIVDDEDYEYLNGFSWSAVKKSKNKNSNFDTTYAKGSSGISRDKSMHKMITGFDQTDHINGIGLDNRRENLRPATTSQNTANSRKPAGKYTSSYKGISWHSNEGKWRACVTVNGKKISLGYFTDEIEAAKAYDRAAIQHFGEYAKTNF